MDIKDQGKDPRKYGMRLVLSQPYRGYEIQVFWDRYGHIAWIVDSFAERIKSFGDRYIENAIEYSKAWIDNHMGGSK